MDGCKLFYLFLLSLHLMSRLTAPTTSTLPASWEITGKSSLLSPLLRQDPELMSGFSSVRGFVRKYDKSGKLLWTVADFEDQVGGPVGLFKHMCFVVVLFWLRKHTCKAVNREDK